MAKAETNILPWLALREALERVGFEVLRPYLHTGRILARHRGMYTTGGEGRSGPGDIPLTLWANAYKDPDGRVFFVTEWVEDGRVIQEKRFAYTLDIDLDHAAFEMYFPAATRPAATRPAASDGMRAAQESTPEQNAETTSSASAAASPTALQTESGLLAPPKITPQAWFKKALEKDHPRQQDEQLIDYAKRLYPLLQAANLTKPWKFETLRRRLDDKSDDKPAKPAPKARRSTGTR